MRRIGAIDLAGVEYDNLTRDEVLDWMEWTVGARRAHMICTPNADHIVLARRDPKFREILRHADLVVPDGMAVVYASWFLGTPFKQNVVGRFLVGGFAERSARRGYRLFLLGGSSAMVAGRAAARLAREYAGVQIAGWYSPPHMREFSATESRRMLDAVNNAHADVLFVCLGTPKQEKWIADHLHHLQVGVAVGVGAALEILADRLAEPPRWVTQIGLEWVFRLAQEPRRLARRYLWNDPRLFWWVLQQRLQRQIRAAPSDDGNAQ